MQKIHRKKYQLQFSDDDLKVEDIMKKIFQKHEKSVI